MSGLALGMEPASDSPLSLPLPLVPALAFALSQKKRGVVSVSKTS